MALLTADLTQIPPAIRQRMHEILSNENAMALVQAKVRQRQAAAWMRNAPRRSVDGIGAQTMVIDPYFQSYFRAKYGTDPVHDPHFRDFLRRQGEDQFFLKPVGTRVQVGWRENVKWRKTYADTPKAA